MPTQNNYIPGYFIAKIANMVLFLVMLQDAFLYPKKGPAFYLITEKAISTGPPRNVFIRTYNLCRVH